MALRRPEIELSYHPPSNSIDFLSTWSNPPESTVARRPSPEAVRIPVHARTLCLSDTFANSPTAETKLYIFFPCCCCSLLFDCSVLPFPSLLGRCTGLRISRISGSAWPLRTDSCWHSPAHRIHVELSRSPEIQTFLATASIPQFALVRAALGCSCHCHVAEWLGRCEYQGGP